MVINHMESTYMFVIGGAWSCMNPCTVHVTENYGICLNNLLTGHESAGVAGTTLGTELATQNVVPEIFKRKKMHTILHL